MTQQRPTHYYIARKPCGCVCQSTADTSYMGEREARWVGKQVAEAIARGCTVQRVDLETVIEWSKDENYRMMNCPHGINKQLVMELENHNGQTG